VIHGRWQVTGKRIYRGHAPGEEFEASLDDAPAARAMNRGDIVLLEEYMPRLVEGSYVLPKGWLG
jgi:hypothetical protein